MLFSASDSRPIIVNAGTERGRWLRTARYSCLASPIRFCRTNICPSSAYACRFCGEANLPCQEKQSFVLRLLGETGFDDRARFGRLLRRRQQRRDTSERLGVV